MSEHMFVDGKDEALLVIVGSARISSICVGAPSFTICTSWPIPDRFWLNFRPPLHYLTDVLLYSYTSTLLSIQT